jgi:hypothetical protein
LLIENFAHVPSTRISEWLPQIAHFNIFVLAHKNADEPAGVLPQWQNFGRNPAAVVLSVMADVIELWDKRSLHCDKPLSNRIGGSETTVLSVSELILQQHTEHRHNLCQLPGTATQKPHTFIHFTRVLVNTYLN